MNVSELLARNARKQPDQAALIGENKRLSYFELDQLVNRMAHSLVRSGISAGDKVVLFLPNSAEWVISYFAVQRLGAIIVPINTKLSTLEVAYILQDCQPAAWIVHDSLIDVADAAHPQPPLAIKTGNEKEGWISFDTLLVADPSPFHCEANEDDDSTILYTSGTTGKPKGVLFTHRNILTVAVMMCIEMQMNGDSRILHMMPFSHSAPLHLFLISGTYVGAAHVVSPDFTPEKLLELVSKEKTTHFFGAPVAYLLTAQHPQIEQYDLSSMTHWVYGGAPLSAPQVKAIKKAFQSDRFYCVYGLTEAGPSGTLLLPHEHHSKAGSIGKRAALNTELRIADENGVDVPTGTVGEIFLFGEGTMKGYFQSEEQTRETMADGWVKTGDLAYKDEDGYIWIVDRKKDVIISGGVNIYPKEAEDLLIAHPLITEAAVVGVPHPDWGETAKAFVVMKEEVHSVEETCKEWLEGKIAHYKIPKLYEQISTLPRNATGKILKQELKKLPVREAE